MKTKILGLLILIIFAVNLSMWANNQKTLPFRTEVTLNGNKLPAGFYEISWISHSPEATVTFVRAGRVMVTAMGKWVDRDTKYTTDASYTATMPMVRIRCSKYASRAGSRRLFSQA